MCKIREVQQAVKEALQKRPDGSLAHQWDHIERVYDISMEIAETYKDSINLEVLQLAALLHDVGETCANKEYHQKVSALIASQLLSDTGYSADIIEKVCTIIMEHSSENDLERFHPSSLESKILFDADKIDAVGAVGITRALILCGQQGKSSEECLRWYQNKIRKVLPFIQTKEGHNLLKKRLGFVKHFLTKYREEAEQFKSHEVNL